MRREKVFIVRVVERMRNYELEKMVNRVVKETID